ncbi:MAG: IS4 family transposase [Hyphomicrobiales bacterium]
MHFEPTIFSQLVEPLDRRSFAAIVERHDGDAYDKSFDSWDHLMALLFAQFNRVDSLRELESEWNAHANSHYHLGCGGLKRSTLSDANARRPVAVFAEVLDKLASLFGRRVRRDAKQFVQLIDSTPIPLGKLIKWAKWNGRIRGMKAHVVYDPDLDLPRILDITDANVNDVEIGRQIELEPGRTYVFDKGYCHYGWWKNIHLAKSVFVTRPKSNMGLKVTRSRKCQEILGDGFTVLADEEVALSSKGDSKLAIPLRRVRVLRHQDNKQLEILTNDMTRSALEIGKLYKLRWQIELLFRWLKQHLKIRKFLGNNENAIKLQIYAAMIAYVLLRIAAAANKTPLDILRLADLVGEFLLSRRRIVAIDRTPQVNENHRRDMSTPNQLAFSYV